MIDWESIAKAGEQRVLPLDGSTLERVRASAVGWASRNGWVAKTHKIPRRGVPTHIEIKFRRERLTEAQLIHRQRRIDAGISPW